MPCQRLRFGLKNWAATSLNGSFYPEGLPPEWRLEYMAGLCTAVWLAGDQVGEEALAAIADAAPSVRVVLEWPLSEAGVATLCDWLAEHGERVLAVVAEDDSPVPERFCVVSPAAIWRPNAGVAGSPVGLIPATDNLRELRAWVDTFTSQREGGGCALLIDGDPPSTGTLERLRTLLEVMGW